MSSFLAAASLALGLVVVAAPDASAQSATFQNAVGSWFGRAVPYEPPCTPGTDGCQVPPEIIMVFTVENDGTFIGIDSNIFAGGSHSTAHGQWVRSGARSIKAEFTLLQSAPTGQFIGGFKNLFNAEMTNIDEMTGSIDAYLYFYVDPQTGLAVVDANGFPTPSPVAPASACATTPGCVSLGKFTFLARRVKVNQ